MTPDNDTMPTGEFDPADVEGSAADGSNAGILTNGLRGYVGYAYMDEEGWLVLLYPVSKRALRINTERQLVIETSYYEVTRQ